MNMNSKLKKTLKEDLTKNSIILKKGANILNKVINQKDVITAKMDKIKSNSVMDKKITINPNLNNNNNNSNLHQEKKTIITSSTVKRKDIKDPKETIKDIKDHNPSQSQSQSQQPNLHKEQSSISTINKPSVSITNLKK